MCQTVAPFGVSISADKQLGLSYGFAISSVELSCAFLYRVMVIKVPGAPANNAPPLSRIWCAHHVPPHKGQCCLPHGRADALPGFSPSSPVFRHGRTSSENLSGFKRFPIVEKRACAARVNVRHGTHQKSFQQKQAFPFGNPFLFFYLLFFYLVLLRHRYRYSPCGFALRLRSAFTPSHS